jgi:CheY-like chemotaxis protein/CRP-like cAMP-binding protein
MKREMAQTKPAPSDALDVSEVIAHAFPESHAATLNALAESGRVISFPAGETILHQGDEGRLVLVLDGHLALRRTTIDGRQLIARIASRGEIGTVPLASRASAADLLALSACQIVMWLPSKARAFAATDPGFAMAIIDHVLASTETIVERVDGLLYQDAITRVARVLYAHRDLFFGEPPVLTRAHLPALVGTSREMTSRVLRVLEARGMVARVGRDRLQIIDLERLEQAVVGPSGVRPRDVRNKFLAMPSSGRSEAAGRPPIAVGPGRPGPGEPVPRIAEGNYGRAARSTPQKASPGAWAESTIDDAPRTRTLLFVEDDPAAREMTTAMLERAGYRVVSVVDGRATIEWLTAQPGAIDLLIADVVQPNVSGLELAEAIIERDPRVGLVLLSRYTSETLDRARIRSHGAVFVLEPVSSPDLFGDIDRASVTSDRR